MSLSDPFALSERALLTVVFVSGVTLLVFWQRRQRSGDDKTNLLLSALARLVGRAEPDFTLFRRTLSGTDLPLSPGTMKIRQILAEIRTTEAAYVATLRLLVKCQRALEGERLLGRAEAAEVFTSAETLMQVNSELLTRLPERPSSLEEIAHAFAAIAPCAAQFCATRRNFLRTSVQPAAPRRYLKVYSEYCARYFAALGALERLRRRSALERRLESLRGECGGQPLESLLIAPVQRLCKYPLLLRELLGALKPNSAARPALEAAAALVGAAADRVNADVRAAENAATMRRVAVEIDYTLPNNTPLLSPTRTLLHDADAEQLRIDEPELRGSHRRTPARLLLFSDGLLVAEPIREPIRGIRRSNGRGSLRARKWINLHHAKVSRDEGDAGGDEGGAYVFVGGDGDDEVFVLSGGTKAAVELVEAFDAAVGAHAAQVKASSNRFSMSRAGIPNFLRRRSGQGNLRRPS